MIPQGGGGGGMGFEETEEIGPDGKPHIISEHSFNPNSPSKPLTPAQKKAQKAQEKAMQAMANDMAHMFSNGGGLGGFGGGFGGGRGGGGGKHTQKYEDDLFKNALASMGQAPLIQTAQRGQHSGKRIPNGWEVKGNSDILNQAGIVVASAVVLGAIVLVGFRYYKMRQYVPIGTDSLPIESQPFRSL